MKVLLICAGGMSTSLLVTRMEEAAAREKVTCEIKAIPLTSLMESVSDSSCLLVAPQIRHRLKSIQEIGEKFSKPVGVINPVSYGRMDGKAVLWQALELIHERPGS